MVAVLPQAGQHTLRQMAASRLLAVPRQQMVLASSRITMHRVAAVPVPAQRGQREVSSLQQKNRRRQLIVSLDLVVGLLRCAVLISLYMLLSDRLLLSCEGSVGFLLSLQSGSRPMQQSDVYMLPAHVVAA